MANACLGSPRLEDPRHDRRAVTVERIDSTNLGDVGAAHARSNTKISPELSVDGQRERTHERSAEDLVCPRGRLRQRGATTVSLTKFWINLNERDLSAVVNGGARVAILSLDFLQADVGLSHGVVTLGPVTASLTKAAADALNGAFGVQAFTEGLTLGKATVHYRLFR